MLIDLGFIQQKINFHEKLAAGYWLLASSQ